MTTMMTGLFLLAWTTMQAPPEAAPAIAEPAPMVLQHRDPAVDALLDRLEQADAGIRDLTGHLVYTRIAVVLGDMQTRIGTLKFVVVAPAKQGARPRRVFLAHFTTFTDGFAVRDEDEQWGFDGQWLMERSARQKLRVARQIAREGDDIDPLRLGEGPLPIPLGQRKAEILTRYTVTARPWDEGLDAEEAKAFRSFAEGATQIHLKPLRPDENFDEVRLWYRDNAQGRLLPVLARSARFNDKGEETDIAFVQLVNVEVNKGVLLQDVAVAAAGAGWQEKVEPLRDESEEAGQGDQP